MFKYLNFFIILEPDYYWHHLCKDIWEDNYHWCNQNHHRVRLDKQLHCRVLVELHIGKIHNDSRKSSSTTAITGVSIKSECISTRQRSTWTNNSSIRTSTETFEWTISINELRTITWYSWTNCIVWYWSELTIIRLAKRTWKPRSTLTCTS